MTGFDFPPSGHGEKKNKPHTDKLRHAFHYFIFMQLTCAIAIKNEDNLSWFQHPDKQCSQVFYLQF